MVSLNQGIQINWTDKRNKGIGLAMKRMQLKGYKAI